LLFVWVPSKLIEDINAIAGRAYARDMYLGKRCYRIYVYEKEKPLPVASYILFALLLLGTLGMVYRTKLLQSVWIEVGATKT
jgi:hypothetical protein